MTTFTPFLTFAGKQNGKAEEAVRLYTSLFPDSKISSLVKRPDGTVMHAVFSLSGQSFMASDGGTQHAWTFTPGVSIFITFASEDELTRAFAKLSEGGDVKMPLDNYGFSKKFGWTDDRYGVSWQLNLR